MSEEFFQINDVVLDVLPTDIMQFGNNAVYEESFLRSEATFAFRSKYSNNKIIITLPINMNPMTSVDPSSIAYSSQKKGLKVLHQLSTYPFCFIKSARIRSYLSSRAQISSTDFMLFAVDEINLIHDMSVSDVLFAEIHVMFNDHTTQAPDFKFVSSDGEREVDDPSNSLVFTDSFEFGFEEKYKKFQTGMSNFEQAVKEGSTTYSYSSNPYNIIEVLTPQVTTATEFNSDTFKSDLEIIKQKYAYKEVKITAKDGNNNLNTDFLTAYSGMDKDGNTVADQKTKDNFTLADPLQTLYIYWTSFHTLSFGGPSSVQSVKISLKNKLVPLFVGTHKYPVVQYVGKFPARMDIVLNFKTDDIYAQGETSVVSAVGQFTNILDYNNEMFPEISAHNTLKIRSVLSQLAGIEDFVPNQTSVRSSATTNGQEIVTLSFIEANISEFVKTGNLTKGRPSIYDNFNSIELAAVLAFSKVVATNPNFRAQIEKSEFKNLYGQITSNLVKAVIAGRRSFYNGVLADELRNYLKDDHSDTTKKIMDSLNNDRDLNTIDSTAKDSTFSNYSYPFSTFQLKTRGGTRVIEGADSYNQSYSSAILVFLTRWQQGLKFINNQTADGKKTFVNNNSLFKNNGMVNGLILDAYQILVSLNAKNDPMAKAIMAGLPSDKSTTTEYLKEQIRSYEGTCLPDIHLTDLVNPDVDPFFYLSYKPYFKKELFLDTHTKLQKDVFNAYEKSLTSSLSKVEGEGGILQSGAWSIFKEEGTSIKERTIVANQTAQGYAATGVGSTSTGFVSLYNSSNKNIKVSKNNNLYDDLINKYAQINNLPAGLLKSLIHQESDFKPNAGSGKGAKGLTQMLDGTAKQMGVTNIYDPEQSIKGGSKYLALMLKQFKTYELALAAYNGGPGNVQKYKGIPPFKETRNYVVEIMNRWRTLYSNGLQGTPTVSTNTDISSTAKLTANQINAINQKNSESLAEKFKNGTYKLVKITAITDGDTFRVEYKGKEYVVRPVGYDAPEIEHDTYPVINKDGTLFKYRTAGNQWGKEATDFFTRSAPVGSSVYLNTDPEKSSEKSTDKYGRVTSSVYLPNTYKDVADLMISTGNALVWANDNTGGNTSLNALIQKQQEAKTKGLGLHSKGVTSDSISKLKARLTELNTKIKEAQTADEVKAILPNYKDVIAENGYWTVKDQSLSFGFNWEFKSFGQEGEKQKQDEAERQKKAADLQTSTSSLNTKTNFDLPVQGLITSSYEDAAQYIARGWGSTTAVKDGKSLGYQVMNFGFDIQASKTPTKNVVTVAKGIADTRYTEGGGKTVIVDHGNGFYTKYMHLQDFCIVSGSYVQSGQVIGIMGETDNIKGEHSDDLTIEGVHYEVWVNISGGMGNGKLVNVHPFKTVSLKMLQNLDPQTVRTHIRDYISAPEISGFADVKGSDAVYGAGNGSSTVLTGNSVNDAPVIPEGALGADPVLDPSMPIDESYAPGYVAVDKDTADPYSVYYEPENVRRQSEVAVYHLEQGLKVMLPTFKMYVVIGSELEDEKIGSSIKNSYYFEVEGVSDMVLICNNDSSPIDYLSCKIANPSFINTDLIAIAGRYLTRDFDNPNTQAEVSFMSDRLRIQAGTRLHLRMGYGNNPNDLVTTFNGVITESSGLDGISLDILAEGFGRELVLDNLRSHNPEAVDSASTPNVIAQAIGGSESLSNFGARATLFKSFIGTVAVGSRSLTGHDYTDPENKRLTTKIAATQMFEPGNWRQRIFTNIYAAEVENLQTSYNTSWSNYFKKVITFNTNEMIGYKYVMMGQSPWEVIKEMEYRHPGTYAKPLFYQDRMTIFYGWKDQMYIARDLEPHFMSKMYTLEDESVNPEYIKERPLRFDPVSKFHLVASEFNLISNGIKANNLFKTGVKVAYHTWASDRTKNKYESFSECDMKVDDTLMAFENRIGNLDMPGIHGKYSAFMYGTTYLKKQMETMYGGTITIVGNPHMKAGDYVHLKDSQKRIEGLVKVRECIHKFNERDGFVTEFTPGLFVEPRDFMYSALMLKLSYTARVCLSNAKLSASIISNENVDFTTYQEYLKQLQIYAKRPTNFFDHLGVSEYTILGNMYYNTGGGAVISAGLTMMAFFGTAKLIFNIGIPWGSIGRVFTSPMAEFASKWATSTTTINMFRKSKAFWRLAASSKAASAASTGKKLTTLGRTLLMFKSAIIGSGGIAWYAATRSLAGGLAIISNALLTNPIGWLIKIGLTIAFTALNNYIQEADLTRQPLMFFPISYNGKPFVTGITGYKYDSFFEAMGTNFQRNIQALSKAGYAVEVSSNNALISSVGRFVQWMGADKYASLMAQEVPQKKIVDNSVKTGTIKQ